MPTEIVENTRKTSLVEHRAATLKYLNDSFKNHVHWFEYAEVKIAFSPGVGSCYVGDILTFFHFIPNSYF